MKPIIHKIANFFKYLLHYRKNRRFEQINKKLSKKVDDIEVDKIILKGEIVQMVRKYLKLDAKSEYIPKEYKNKAEIREQVLYKFGDRMKKLNVKINAKLELV
ncbi:hypothetical protein [Flavobacterium denitrificans]|uniref:hypothetical protein n=1 Tax=Flavobacterium denitrificans TaxID=281361 RepID=UPI000421835D|nr:hypothetical protein [Flavobacterium denitrificans]